MVTKRQRPLNAVQRSLLEIIVHQGGMCLRPGTKAWRSVRALERRKLVKLSDTVSEHNYWWFATNDGRAESKRYHKELGI